MLVDFSLAKQVIKNAYNGDSDKNLMLDSTANDCNNSKNKSEVFSDDDSDDNGNGDFIHAGSGNGK